MRRQEMARRRRNLSEKRNEEVKVRTSCFTSLMLQPRDPNPLPSSRPKPSTSCSSGKHRRPIDATQEVTKPPILMQ